MTTDIRKFRKKAALSLNELAVVLGPGFSPARLSLAERGLVKLTQSERDVILAAVEKVGSLRAQARDIIERASGIDLIAACQDIRQQAQAIHASA